MVNNSSLMISTILLFCPSGSYASLSTFEPIEIVDVDLELQTVDLALQQPIVPTQATNKNWKKVRAATYTLAALSTTIGITQLLSCVFTTPQEASESGNTTASLAATIVTCSSLIIPTAVGAYGAFIIKKVRKSEQDIGKLLLSSACSSATHMLSFVLPGASTALNTTGGLIATGLPTYIWLRDLSRHMNKSHYAREEFPQT